MIVSDWMKENQIPINFELLEAEKMADLLRKLYGTVLTKKGTPYSKSGMINLRAGLNRHLQNPPFNRTIDIMNDPQFLPANKVFTGRMRDNKEKGLDVSKPRQSIDQEDLQKLFNNYFKKAVETKNTKLLMHKVFFDIVYYTGRRAKEGLRELSKNSFDIKTGSDGLEYVEITFNEKSKKNQGNDNSTSVNALHNDHHIISAMPGNPLCPVQSFKTYLSLLNDQEKAFFQYPNKKLDGFNNAPIGKNSIGNLMKDISTDANLSRIYTNHCIRKTTATALKRKGFDLNEISHVTKHKNLDSLKHYIGGPTYNDKRKYNDAMSSYATGNMEPSSPQPETSKQLKLVPLTPKTPEIPQSHMNLLAAEAPVMDKTRQTPEKSLIPMFEDSEETSSLQDNTELVPVKNTQNQQNVVNTLRNASHLFQNATFNNCNFTFQMPK